MGHRFANSRIICEALMYLCHRSVLTSSRREPCMKFTALLVLGLCCITGAILTLNFHVWEQVP